MIKIKAYTKPYSNSMTAFLRVTGHADYAPAGSDIVCAAVSALTQSWMAYLDEMDLKPEIVSFEDGCIDMTVTGESSCISKPFLMLYIGLEMIANTYPENVVFNP